MWRKPLVIVLGCLLLLLAVAEFAQTIGPTGRLSSRVSGNAQPQLALAGPLPPGIMTSTAAGHTFWYVSRATALTAYLLLFFNICLGLGMSAGLLDGLLPRWRVLDLHESTALVALGFTAVHMLTLLGDPYRGFTLGQVLVPFAATYRPAWTALGLFAFYLAVAVTASYYVRRRIGQRAWRALHYASYGAFVMALGHAVLSGTDTGEPWTNLLYYTTGTAVAVLTILRMMRKKAPTAERASRISPERP